MAAASDFSPGGLPADLARYARQIAVDGVGLEGQSRLKHACVTLVGCGALGGVLASTLVRAGVGRLCIIDRDYIEPENLQRQVLFDERDIAECLPKAEAAARKLRRANSAVEVDAVVADLDPLNAEALCSQADLLLDGTDNLQTRFLINDVAVKHDIPWVYGACAAAEGLVLPVLPHRTPCLRCIWDQPPAPGEAPGGETAGLLAAAANIVASLQATEAMKILMGREAELAGGMLTIDAWSGQVRPADVQAARDGGDCRCCKRGEYAFLGRAHPGGAKKRIGPDAVQIMPADETELDLRRLARRLPAHTKPGFSEFLLRFRVDGLSVVVFRDGRTIVRGTGDAKVAQRVITEYVGC